MNLIIVIVFIITTSGTFVLSRTTGGRIIGGREATEGQFPFIAAINVVTSNSTFFCGGALVSTQYILTSAQCVNGAVVVVIQLGSSTLANNDDEAVAFQSTEVVLHPEFNPTTLINDIGLIKLPEPVEITDLVQTIRLATINLPDFLTPTALGWGQLADATDELSNYLQYVDLSIISNSECRQTYGNQINDNMLCVIGSSNEGTCTGDSGSPLVVRPLGSWQLEHVGVSTFVSGNGCENSDPSGYTRTYPYVEWINSVIGTQGK